MIKNTCHDPMANSINLRRLSFPDDRSWSLHMMHHVHDVYLRSVRAVGASTLEAETYWRGLCNEVGIDRTNFPVEVVMMLLKLDREDEKEFRRVYQGNRATLFINVDEHGLPTEWCLSDKPLRDITKDDLGATTVFGEAAFFSMKKIDEYYVLTRNGLALRYAGPDLIFPKRWSVL